MIEVNFSPYTTSKNYGVNSVFVDEKIIKNKFSKFDGFSSKNASEVKFLTDFDAKTTQNIAEVLTNQTEKQANFVREIIISDSQNEPYYFDFDLSQNDLVGEIKLLTKCDLNAKVVVRFHSNKKSYANTVLKVVCEKNSKLDLIVVFDFEKESANFVCFDCLNAENAKLNFNVVDFGCKTSIQNFYANLCGDNSVCNLKSAYLGDNEDLIDLLYYQDIHGKKCSATIDAIGVLNKNAKKNFKSIVSFKKGCKKSFGSENEFCLLLSDTAKSKALPMLLCEEEDVDGKHSTSIGRANEKELFYIMSRGIDRKEALKLIVKAKVNDFVSNLFDDEIKNDIFRNIDREFDDEN